MKTIIIHSTNFNINNDISINSFRTELQKITEPFEIKFDFPLTKIPNYLFFLTNLAKISIPDSVTKIEESVFTNCMFLTEITLPNSIKEIGACTFTHCKHLKEITLPNSITEINKGLFFDCSSLAEITIPDSVTKIGFGAFKSCISLKKITIPKSIKFLDSEIFSGCISLKEIVIPSSKKDFFKNVEGAKNFYETYKDIISFEDRTLDDLLSKNDSIESIINNIDQER